MKKMSRKTRSKIRSRIAIFAGIGILAALAVFIVVTLIGNANKSSSYKEAFMQKEAILRQTVVTPEHEESLKNAAGDAGYVVFISVCDTIKRAYVYTGTGSTLGSAWESASDAALKGVSRNIVNPVWVKAETVINVEPRTLTQIKKDIANSLDCYYHYGLAFEGSFDFALTEGECNATKIFDYDDNIISLKYLNRYLKETGRTSFDSLPDNYLRFQTGGYICDEDSRVYELCTAGLSYGRRVIDGVDADYVKQLIKYDLDYLRSALHSDGKFDYAVLARFDNQIDWYNTARHAGTIWSMIQGYQLWPEQGLKDDIDKALGYLKDQIIYNGDAAYIYWENRDNIELGANAIALMTFTEYVKTFGDNSYLDICKALAKGIMTMQNEEKGTFIHVLNKDFTVSKEFDTVYYEGEAAYSLLKLYELTHDETLYNVAKKHVERFIAENYVKYNDHWMSYTFNEITKYDDDPRYYEFALRNVTANLSYIRARRTPAPTRMEQIMCAFELYERAVERGIPTDGFDIKAVLETLTVRTQRMLDGRFYPEIAMHMQNPKHVVNTYMMRYLNYRIRIDDIQHNIGGSLMYMKYYDKLVECGMPTSAKTVDQGDQNVEGPEEPDEPDEDSE